MPLDLTPGLVVAERYQLERRLGEGGMGVVWLAQHRKTKKRVALKFVKKEGAGEQGKRLLREARAASVVRHPNVREVYDVLEDAGGSPIIVMEYLEGRPLSALLAEEKRLTLERTASILIPVISALGTAHALGIVHRDLKPENIFLVEVPSPDVKVVDFGIAKLTATEGDAAATAGITGTGAILGTPHFMAPEQVFGEKRIDHRADIWALGLVLYQALSGVLPTEAENVGQVMKIIVSRGIQPLAVVAPDVPEDVAAVVDRMLVRSLSGRLTDLREVQEVLAKHADVEVPDFAQPAVVPSGRDQTEPEGSGSTYGAATTAAASGRSHRATRSEPPRRGFPFGVAALVLAGVGAVALLVTRAPAGGAPVAASAASSRPTSERVADAPSGAVPEVAATGLAATAAEPTSAAAAATATVSADRPGAPAPTLKAAATTTPSGTTAATGPPTSEPAPTVRVQTEW